MTYIIAEPCLDVKDTACVDVCPVEATFEEAAVPEHGTNKSALTQKILRNQGNRTGW